ncbi:hypothetical protein EGW08_009454 [Elysia chlorotica]|uniref:Uncharacterized protein n=1 Tax=Elysia chlorotica TaxID=188477 RepID=A0A3S0ZMZ5_ELYCH|nr:hypothetical protein EGW08_009454 [Elysia chlorotica]
MFRPGPVCLCSARGRAASEWHTTAETSASRREGGNLLRIRRAQNMNDKEFFGCSREDISILVKFLFILKIKSFRFLREEFEAVCICPFLRSVELQLELPMNLLQTQMLTNESILPRCFACVSLEHQEFTTAELGDVLGFAYSSFQYLQYFANSKDSSLATFLSASLITWYGDLVLLCLAVEPKRVRARSKRQNDRSPIESGTEDNARYREMVCPWQPFTVSRTTGRR